MFDLRFARVTNLVGELVVFQQTQGHHSGSLVATLHVLDELLYVPEFGRHFRMVFLISALLLALRLGLIVRALLLGFFTDKTNSRTINLAGEQSYLRFCGLQLGRLRDFHFRSVKNAVSRFYTFSKVYLVKKKIICFCQIKIYKITRFRVYRIVDNSYSMYSKSCGISFTSSFFFFGGISQCQRTSSSTIEIFFFFFTTYSFPNPLKYLINYTVRLSRHARRANAIDQTVTISAILLRNPLSFKITETNIAYKIIVNVSVRRCNIFHVCIV